MKAMRGLRSYLGRQARSHELTWRYVLNARPSIGHRLETRPLACELRPLLDDLNRDGVVVTTAEALFGTRTAYEELERAAGALMAERAGEVAELRRALSRGDVVEAEKDFLIALLGDALSLDPACPLARFALDERFSRLSAAYYGMRTQLRYFNVWHTLADARGPRKSQLWHFDREDFFILKVFVYLSDVDEGAGPFTYAPGTHRKGACRARPEFFLEDGVARSTDAQMAAVVPEAAWRVCTGGAGTIVLADTRGYHKGGHARTSDRVMFTAMFTSPASQSREFIRRERGKG